MFGVGTVFWMVKVNRWISNILSKWPAVIALAVILPTMAAPVSAWHHHDCCDDHSAQDTQDTQDAGQSTHSEADDLCSICFLSFSLSAATIEVAQPLNLVLMVRSVLPADEAELSTTLCTANARAPPARSTSL